jgi:Acyl-CoA reductase (LuxC)
MTVESRSALVSVPFVVRGRVSEGVSQTPYGTAAPGGSALDLNELVWPGHLPVPLSDVPTTEIIELLSQVGDWVRRDPDGVLAQALESLVEISSASRPLAERSYAELWRYFSADLARFQLEQELGGTDVTDSWRSVEVPGQTRPSFVRAFPARMVHVLAGNAPGVAAISIVRSALVKGASLLKLASNDLFTAPALLRAVSAVAPGHPLEQSLAAVYWRGGDDAVESVLMRPQFFDKLVVWGGAQAVRGVARYVCPGLDLVSFDPKTSISLIGRDAFAPGSDLRRIAVAAATDATVHNQDACTASRFQFVEGPLEDVDRFCALLVAELGVERHKAAARSEPVPADLRDEIDALRYLAPYYRVWGATNGTGLVVRSEEPVTFYPTGRVVNVVAVSGPEQVFEFINASTQTVGIYPDRLRADLRDQLCRVGVQRVTSLGHAGDTVIGLPHDGFYPLSRMVRWGKDEP